MILRMLRQLQMLSGSVNQLRIGHICRDTALGDGIAHPSKRYPLKKYYLTLTIVSLLDSQTMKCGLCLVSKYILARYCPMIPIQKSCNPLIKIMMQMVEAHPATGSPKINFRIMIIAIKKNEHKVITIPNQEEIFKGI